MIFDLGFKRPQSHSDIFSFFLLWWLNVTFQTEWKPLCDTLLQQTSHYLKDIWGSLLNYTSPANWLDLEFIFTEKDRRKFSTLLSILERINHFTESRKRTILHTELWYSSEQMRSSSRSSDRNTVKAVRYPSLQTANHKLNSIQHSCMVQSMSSGACSGLPYLCIQVGRKKHKNKNVYAHGQNADNVCN